MLIRDKHIDPAADFVQQSLALGLAPAINLTNAVLRLIKLPRQMKVLAAGLYTRVLAGTVSIDLRLSAADGILVNTVLAIDATPEKFKTITTTAVYLIAGAVKTKAATAALVFSAAHVISADKAGAILVQLDAAGAVSTKVSSATQAFNTAAEAEAALPAADAAKVAIGYITIVNNAGDWTANTDDLTDASDVTTATFNVYGVRKPLTGAIAAVALVETAGVVSATATDVDGDEDEYLAVIGTTDGTGALTDGVLTVHYRPRSLRGDAA